MRIIGPMSSRAQPAAPRWSESRPVHWITWIAILVPLPYTLSRLLWAVGLPIGIDAEFLREINCPGWGSLGVLFLAALTEGTSWWTAVFVRKRETRFPAWVPGLGHRRLKPWMVVAPLFPPIAILAWFNLATLVEIASAPSGGTDNGEGLPGWSLWGQLTIFWIWGLSLPIATAAYIHAMRARRVCPQKSLRPARPAPRSARVSS